jgi:hypothetical protein
MQRRAAEAIGQAQAQQQELLGKVIADEFSTTDAFMDTLGALRKQLGHLVTVKEVRYIELPKIEAMEAEVKQAFDDVSTRCVNFLLTPKAFEPLHAGVQAVSTQTEKVVKTVAKKKKTVAKNFKSFDEWWQNVAQKKVEKIENKWLKENEPNNPEDEGGGDHWHVNEMMHGGDASEMTYEIAREAWEKIASGEVWEFGQESSLYCELDDVIIEAAKAAKR